MAKAPKLMSKSDECLINSVGIPAPELPLRQRRCMMQRVIDSDSQGNLVLLEASFVGPELTTYLYTLGGFLLDLLAFELPSSP